MPPPVVTIPPPEGPAEIIPGPATSGPLPGFNRAAYEATRDFTVSAAAQLGYLNGFGPEPGAYSNASYYGLWLGRILGLVQSMKEMEIGGTVAAGGFALSLTGEGALVGVPAIAGGAAIAAHGSLVGVNSLRSTMSNLGKGPPGAKISAAEVKRFTHTKHHPNSASPEPNNVEELWRKAVLDPRTGNRWAKDANGVIHRFSPPSNGRSHWNGSTAPGRGIPQDKLPKRDILNQLK